LSLDVKPGSASDSGVWNTTTYLNNPGPNYPIFKGIYSISTTYNKDDIVSATDVFSETLVRKYYSLLSTTAIGVTPLNSGIWQPTTYLGSTTPPVPPESTPNFIDVTGGVSLSLPVQGQPQGFGNIQGMLTFWTSGQYVSVADRTEGSNIRYYGTFSIQEIGGFVGTSLGLSAITKREGIISSPFPSSGDWRITHISDVGPIVPTILEVNGVNVSTELGLGEQQVAFAYLPNPPYLWRSGQYVSITDRTPESNLTYYGVFSVQNNIPILGTGYGLSRITGRSGAGVPVLPALVPFGILPQSDLWTITYISETPPQ
jgi:hypothetical protein